MAFGTQFQLFGYTLIVVVRYLFPYTFGGRSSVGYVSVLSHKRHLAAILEYIYTKVDLSLQAMKDTSTKFQGWVLKTLVSSICICRVVQCLKTKQKSHFTHFSILRAKRATFIF